MHIPRKNSFVRQGLTLSLFLAALYGCGESEATGEPGQRATQPENTYRYVQVEEQHPSEDSPVGYWETSLKYPQLNNPEHKKVLDTVNKAIAATVDSYKCEGPGDHSFEGTVSFSDKHLFSMKYDAMWMCDTMPNIGSDTGAQVYNLANGKQVKLADEFKDAASGDQIKALIKTKFKAALAGLDASLACPQPEDEGSFYIQGQDIVFIARFLSHADSACEMEVSLPLSELTPKLKADSVLAH